MAGDPAPYPHTNGRNLLVVYPNARQIGDSTPFDPIGGDRLDENLLEVPHIPMDVTAIRSEVEDGISHHLTWTMVGDVAASTGFPNLDATFSQRPGRRENVGAATVAADADCQDVRVLDQKE